MPGDEIDYGSARISIDLDDAGTVDDARDLGLRIRRALDRATRDTGDQIRRNIQRGLTSAAVTVRVEPDLRRFDAALLRGLRSLSSIEVPVTPDLTGFVDAIRAHLAGEEVSIRVVPDFDGFDDRVRAHDPPDVTVHVDTDVESDVDTDRFSRGLRGLAGIAGTVGKSLGSLLKFGAIGIAAAGATQSIIGLGAALAPAAGIIAAAPAAIAGFQAALGTLRLALVGVGDALKAAFGEDAAAFQKALDKLSPSAQKAVLAVRALAPQLKAVQQGVQEAFFSRFAGEVDGAVRNLLPLSGGLKNIATGFGNAAREGLKFLQTQQAVAPLRQILDGTSAAVNNLKGAVAPLAQGFLDVAGSVSQAFGARLGTGISSAAQSVGDFLSRIANSGQAVSWVDGALTVFQQLGAIIKNVGSILSGVFQAANASGGGLLNNLKAITASFAQFVNSAQGQEAIGNIFGAIAKIAAQLGPILSAVVAQVGAIAPALEPIFTALGPAIVNLVNALGPALAAIAPALATVGQALAEGLGALGPSLGPLGQAIGSALAALAPLLPLVGQLAGVVAAVLAPALDAVTAVLRPIIDALVAALLPVLPQVAAAFVAVGNALGPVAEVLGKSLGDALLRLLPPILELVPQIADKMVPAWIALAEAITPLVPELVNLVVLAIEPLLPMVPQLVGMVADLSSAFVLTLATIVPILPPLIRLATIVSQFLTSKTTIPVLQALVDSIGLLVTATVVVNAKLRAFTTATIGFFRDLPGNIIDAVTALPGQLASFFSGLWTTVSSAVSTGFNAVIDFFTSLPGKIGSALAALPGLLVDLFVNAVAGIAIALITGIAALIFIFTELPGKIVSALASLGSSIASAFSTAFTATVSAVSSFISSAVRFFSELPGKIGSALTALPGKVAGLFRSVGTSALSAARTFGSSVVDFFTKLPGRLADGLSSLGSKLVSKISSAGSAALRGARDLVSTIAGAFTKLPGLILQKIGDIGGRIRQKIRSGLPSSLQGVIPGLANGGIVTGPTTALIGEAGPEVVIPLSRPKRARELAANSGLMRILAGPSTAATLAVGNAATLSGGSGKALQDAGRQLVAGLIVGIRDGIGDLDQATRDLVERAIVTAEDTLGIASPSKVFAAIGKQVGKGFIVGLTGTAAQIKATTEKLAKSITDAFKGKATRVDDRLVTLLQAGNKKLTGLAAQRDALAQKIADAQKFATDTASQVLSSFSLQNVTQNATELSANSITAGLSKALAQVKAFNTQVAALAKKGLRKDLLQQIIGLGPEQGADLARVLATADKATFKRVNSLQASLVDASNVLGRTSADALFDAGAQAGRGFLAGLQGQRKAIEKLMVDIAKSMQKAIRTALRIKSPSVVFRKIGEMTGAGLHLGIVSRIASLAKASRTAARAVVDAVTGQFDVLPDRVGASLEGIGAGAGNVVPITVAQRRRQATAETGAADLVRGRGAAASGAVINNSFVINEVGDGHATAHRVLNRLTFAAGVS